MYTSHNRVKHEENKVNVEPKVLFSCQLVYSAILNLLPVLPRCAYHFICHDDGHEHILYIGTNNDTTSLLWKMMTKYYCPVPLLLFNFQNSDPELGNMEVDSLPVLAALSLVPRPHPPALTKRNGLVEFLGLVYAFAKV